MRSAAALVPLALLTVLTSLTSVACSGDDDDGGPGAADAAGEGTDLATIAGGLASLPQTGEEAETIVWGDLERAAEAVGVERPADPGDGEAAEDYLRALTIGTDGAAGAGVVTPESAHLERSRDQTAILDELGWSAVEVDRFVERQTPPGVMTVMQGSFDEDALTEALGEPDDGTWSVGPGEDFARDLEDVSPARPIGESLWLGLDGDRLSVTRSSGHSAAVRRVLAGAGGTPTFAADEALAAVAGALDAESPYAAVLIRPGLSGPPPEIPAGPSELGEACQQALPVPTTAVGTAAADADGPVIVLALAHGSPEAAEANAEAVERIATEGATFAGDRPWTEIVSLDDVSVADDDRTVVARLRPRETRNSVFWYQIVVQQESLVTSC